MITRAVVTGGAGFIGSNLVDRLIDDGAEVLVVDDLSSGRLERLREARSRAHQMTFHQMDARAPELADVVERFEPEVVFHLAARPAGGDRREEASVAVVGTVNVLEAAIPAGVSGFIVATSGPAIYGRASRIPTPESAAPHPETATGVSALAAEAYVRHYSEAYGVAYAVLRLANVYGPRQGGAGAVGRFVGSLLRGERPTIFGDGTQTRDFVFVEDATDALVRAAAAGGGRTLNIGSGRETSIHDLYGMVRDLTGRGRLEPAYAAGSPEEIERSCLDPTQAKKHLGWEAWTTLQRGLRHTVEWERRR